MRTTLISVSFNSEAVLGAMIASAVNSCKIIVVDNNSSDNSAKIAEQFGAKVIALAENQGFGQACNAGALDADTEFLLFFNPDAVLLPNAIFELEAAADRYKNASAFNPAISDGKGVPYFKRRSKLLSRRNWMKAGWPDKDCDIPVLSGAAIFCRRKSFEAIGGFDPAIFLYHEDDDLALRLKAECGLLMFIRSARVMHQEGRSSPRSAATATIKSYHMARSAVYTMRKHKRPFAFARNFLGGLTKITSPIIVFSPRKRAQAIAFMRGVWSMRSK
jgi:N-acetylglucosaminyl-diphospho-decaprenol L-rhamnosyltransferase